MGRKRNFELTSIRAIKRPRNSGISKELMDISSTAIPLSEPPKIKTEVTHKKKEPRKCPIGPLISILILLHCSLCNNLLILTVVFEVREMNLKIFNDDLLNSSLCYACRNYVHNIKNLLNNLEKRSKKTFTLNQASEKKESSVQTNIVSNATLKDYSTQTYCYEPT